jgi:exopolysaccharide biosynthesis polyprenyl glycosylphosphotransferase
MLKHRLYGRNYKKILLLGDLPKNGTNSIHDFFDPITGHKITKHLPLLEMLREVDKVPTLVKQELASSDYDILLVASPLEFGKYLYKVIDIAENNGLRVAFYPHFVSSINHKLEVSYIDDFPLINVRAEPLQFLPNRIVKRAIDLIVASITFILFYWWFYLIIGAIIKFTSEGPIIFKQKRIGADNEKFWFYKFRTMTSPENEEVAINGARGITEKNDPRVTKIGNFLRKTNLDELPQIINVLKGDMSIVGPRPHMLEEDLEVRKRVKKYMVRQFVRPGITGWAAVNGYRGGTDDMDLMQQRVKHDIYYIESWTPLFDLKIIGKTIWQMITFNIPNAY